MGNEKAKDIIRKLKDVVHVYGQSAWHDDVFFVGTREGLQNLQQLLDSALEKNPGEDCPLPDRRTTGLFFSADGEGYYLHVVEMTPDDMDRMENHYTDPITHDPPDPVIRCRDFFTKEAQDGGRS